MVHTGFFRFLGILLVLGCLLSLASPTARAELNLASEAAILMDAATGQVLYEKNMHQRMYPASITKVMTAMLALEVLPAGQTLTVSQSAVYAVPRTSSHISLQPGEQITLEQAMYAIGMESANDAANVLAEAISGTLGEFAQRMTQKAHSLGAQNTQFCNANGLPDSSHYTTAYDMALIVAAALKTPGLNQYFHNVKYQLPATNLSGARNFSNKNRLLPGGQYAYENVLLTKTGWTTAAQGTFVAAVEKNGTTLIVVALKSPMLEDKYRDTCQLLDYGFANYNRAIITGEDLAEKLNLEGYLPKEGQDFPILLPQGVRPSDVTFSLEAGTGVSEEAGTPCVYVTAALGTLLIPNLILYLDEDAPEEPLAVIASAISEILEPEEPETSGGTGVYFAAAAAGVLFFYALIKTAHNQHLRRNRRRELHAKIRRMKKQMQ